MEDLSELQRQFATANSDFQPADYVSRITMNQADLPTNISRLTFAVGNLQKQIHEQVS